MRLLHTSDWHLGQTLHNYERTYEHQCFLDWLLATLEAEQPDALLIAGDIFDNGNPSAASLKQFYRFLQQARARRPGMAIVVTAGNHDSPGRIEAPGPLLEAHDVHVIGQVARAEDGSIDLERMLLPLPGKDGGTAAWCLAIPFLRPGDVPREEGQEGDAYLNGIAVLYRQAYALAEQRRAPGQPIIAMGHCHMVDGKASTESERRIVIGGTEALPASIFDPGLAYAALGHLHLAQSVGQKDHIRYCGSPLPLSFAELGYMHQVLRVDLGADTVVTPLSVPRAVELMRVPARPAPLEEVLAALAALTLPDLPLQQQPYLEVRVLEDAPQPGKRARIEAALAGKPIRLAKIESTSMAAPASIAAPLSLDQLARIEPDDIFKRLYTQRYAEEAPPDLVSAFRELMLAAGRA
ncbi:MAG: exonuclease SbcCD subunit D C-terminal domain-containing protein [Pseudomonadota bacterium]